MKNNLIHTYSNKAFKGIGVNWKLPFLHGDSLKITSQPRQAWNDQI